LFDSFEYALLFAKLREAIFSFAIPVRPSIGSFRLNNSALMGWIFMKQAYLRGVLSQKSVEKFQIGQK
jgi:hypothetical protein